MLSRRIPHAPPLLSLASRALLRTTRALAANVTRFVAAHQRRFRERRVNTEFAGLNSTKVVDEVVLRTEIPRDASRLYAKIPISGRKLELAATTTCWENDALPVGDYVT